MVTVIPADDSWQRALQQAGADVGAGYTDRADDMALQKAIRELPADATPRQRLDAILNTRTYSPESKQRLFQNYLGVEKMDEMRKTTQDRAVLDRFKAQREDELRKERQEQVQARGQEKKLQAEDARKAAQERMQFERTKSNAALELERARAAREKQKYEHSSVRDKEKHAQFLAKEKERQQQLKDRGEERHVHAEDTRQLNEQKIAQFRSKEQERQAKVVAEKQEQVEQNRQRAVKQEQDLEDEVQLQNALASLPENATSRDRLKTILNTPTNNREAKDRLFKSYLEMEKFEGTQGRNEQRIELDRSKMQGTQEREQKRLQLELEKLQKSREDTEKRIELEVNKLQNTKTRDEKLFELEVKKADNSREIAEKKLQLESNKLQGAQVRDEKRLELDTSKAKGTEEKDRQRLQLERDKLQANQARDQARIDDMRARESERQSKFISDKQKEAEKDRQLLQKQEMELEDERALQKTIQELPEDATPRERLNAILNTPTQTTAGKQRLFENQLDLEKLESTNARADQKQDQQEKARIASEQKEVARKQEAQEKEVARKQEAQDKEERKKADAEAKELKKKQDKEQERLLTQQKINEVRDSEGFEDLDEVEQYKRLTGAGVPLADAERESKIKASQLNRKTTELVRSYEAQKKFIDDTTAKHRGFESDTKPKLQLMAQLGNSELITPTANAFREALGIPLGSLDNPNNELYQKTSLDLLKGLPETYGNRIMKVEVDNFLRTIPTLENSAEGRRMIVSSLLKLGQMKEIFYNQMRGLQQEYLDQNKAFPQDFEQRVLDRSLPMINKANDQFAKMSQIRKVPPNHVAFFSPMGEIQFVPNDQVEWAEQNGGERIW